MSRENLSENGLIATRKRSELLSPQQRLFEHLRFN